MDLVGLLQHFQDLQKLVMDIGGQFTNPLVNGAVTTSTLAGITGSASGGMGIALGAMAEKYNQQLQQQIFHQKLCTVLLPWHQVVWIHFRTMELLLHY